MIHLYLTVCSSDYIATNETMTKEKVPGKVPEEHKKTCQDNQSLEPDMNVGPTKYKVGGNINMDLTGTGSDGMDQIHVIRMQTGDDRFL
jgi:hypothetical protein